MFLKLSEQDVGEYDALFSPVPYIENDFGTNFGWGGLEYYFNYTLITEKFGDTYNLSPRMHRCQ